MTTKTTKKTPAPKKTSTKKATPAPVVDPITTNTRLATQTEIEKAVEQARVWVKSEVLPGLLAKYGPNTIPEGENPSNWEVDKLCHDEYVAARTQKVLDILASKHLEVKRPGFNLSLNYYPDTEMSLMSKAKKSEAVKAEAKAAANPKPTVDRVETPHGSFIKGSVLHNIYRSFDLKNGATKDEMLDRLEQEFCQGMSETERAARRANFVYTVNTQIYAMPKDREFTLGRDEQGRYGIHIQGYYKGRVLTPEQKKAKADAEKAKAEKAAARQAKADAKAKAAAEKAAKAAAEKAKVATHVPSAQVVGKVKVAK